MVRSAGRGAVAVRLGATVLGGAVLLGACGGDPEPDAGGGAAAPVSRTVDPPEALDLIFEDTVVIDVRTPAEFAAGHVDGAVNLDLQSEEFLTEVQALPADEPYVVYCETGNRSAQAVDLMAAEGFDELYDAGGFDGLADAGADLAQGSPR